MRTRKGRWDGARRERRGSSGRGRRARLLALVSMLAFPPVLTAQEPSVPVFAALEGVWEGTGTLMGRPASFTMEWRRAADGFVRLTFTNGFVDEDGVRTPVLRAEATYLVRGATAQGVWIDSRPQRITLQAELSDTSVVTTWTAERERGRTEYVVVGSDEIVVRDFVEADVGLRPFGEARYRRSGGVPR